jgi:hypothetical protein
MQCHVYAWAKSRGFFGRRGGEPASHLLLDGGVLCVPDPASFEFIHEYAKGVVRGGPAPCVVEVRTPVFRMFYDLDAHAAPEMAEQLSRGDVPGAVAHFICALIGATIDRFDAPTVGTAVLCVADAPKALETGKAKIGLHVTFDGVFATPASARYVRERVLTALADVENPFMNAFHDIVDEAVYKGSGMRLPWSAKKQEPRAYVPVGEWSRDGPTAPIDHMAIEKSVAAVRGLLERVALRTSVAATRLCDTADGEAPDGYAPADPRTNLSHASLRDFEDVVPAVEAAIEAAIPEAYARGGRAGRVTGVVRGDHVVLFRHSSRYCANVDREHHTSNTYFMLTREGLRQCCYSRKDSCSHFRGNLLEVPAEAIERCLPVRSNAPTVAAMPSTQRATRTVGEVVGEMVGRASKRAARPPPQSRTSAPRTSAPRTSPVKPFNPFAKV